MDYQSLDYNKSNKFQFYYINIIHLFVYIYINKTTIHIIVSMKIFHPFVTKESEKDIKNIVRLTITKRLRIFAAKQYTYDKQVNNYMENEYKIAWQIKDKDMRLL